MKEILLTKNLLNSNKILFHYGTMIPEIVRGKQNFNPVAIEIHPTAKCNHRCIHCSYMERNESRVSLSGEVMDSLVNSIINMGIKAVYFSGGGEPTLYPELPKYITKLHENGVECALITNASCFNRMGFVPIANMFNYIAISVPGIDDDTFSTITGADTLNEVLSLPGQIKEVHGDNSPILGSRVVLTNKNYTVIEDFLSIIKEKMFDYALFKIVRDYEDNGQGLSKEEESWLKEKIESLKDIDENFSNVKRIFDYRKNEIHGDVCWANHYGMIANVSMDGKVYPNIVEIDKEAFCIGDLNKESLEEMWNSKRHDEVKELSNKKWQNKECKNCRAISYNLTIDEIENKIPREYDPFI